MQTLIKTWWLLALCGVLDAIISVINFDHAGNGFHAQGPVMQIGMLALAAGVCTIAIARTLRRQRHVADEWLLASAGVASVGFALVFFAFVFGWIKMEPGPTQTVLWLASYFGFSAVCMLALALRLHPSHTTSALPAV